MNKKAESKSEVKRSKQTKKGNTVLYIGIGLIVGVLILSFVTGILNTAAESGSLNVISGENQITPVSHKVKETVGGKETSYPFYIIEELPDDLPEIEFDKELYLKYDGKTLSDFAFFMYFENEEGDIKSVYENIPKFDHPKDNEGNIIPGKYIVKLKFSWGTSNKNSITEEHFFIINYK